MLLLCHQYPYLRIYNPATGSYVSFTGGKLEISPDDPNYEVVMAEASRNPSIVVYEHILTCEWCGESFTGRTEGRTMLADHIKDVHYDKWRESVDEKFGQERIAELKSREGFACDACRPAQVFGTERDLQAHMAAIHLARPVIDDDGNILGEAGGGGRGRRRRTEIPEAKTTS